MEEPDTDGTPVVFSATEEANPKKEPKTSVGDRLRKRKSTPKLVMKGNGRKSYSFSPSPEQKPADKRANNNADSEEDGKVVVGKRNLLEELNEVADSKKQEVLGLAGLEEGMSSDVKNLSSDSNKKNGRIHSNHPGDCRGALEPSEVRTVETIRIDKKQGSLPEQGPSLPEKTDLTAGGAVSPPQPDRGVQRRCRL